MLVVVGDIDATTILDVERQLAGQPAADVNAVVVDLSRVSFCSATGISVLLALLKRTNAGAVPLTLVVDTPPVRRTLEVLDQAKHFSICADRAAALATLSAP